MGLGSHQPLFRFMCIYGLPYLLSHHVYLLCEPDEFIIGISYCHSHDCDSFLNWIWLIKSFNQPYQVLIAPGLSRNEGPGLVPKLFASCVFTGSRAFYRTIGVGHKRADRAVGVVGARHYYGRAGGRL
jgi:hypothetical protein